MTARTVIDNRTCDVCRGQMETDRTQLVCVSCTFHIFPRCQGCDVPLIPNWSGSILPHYLSYGSVSLVEHTRNATARNHWGMTGISPIEGPFVCEAMPVAVFGAPFVETLERGRHTSSGEMVCMECGHPCVECGELHDTGEDALVCCDPDRQCDSCGEWWEDEREARGCCGERFVHHYNYRPTLKFHDANEYTFAPIPGVLYMGAELEMERVTDHLEDWYEHEDFTFPTFTFWKEDGSLEDNGAELVTMPATLDAMRATFPWRELERLHANGARAFHMGTCGMHVHVSRSAFSPTHLWRFVKLQTKNVGMCEAIAQRSQSHWARWSSHGNVDDSGGTLPDYVKGKDQNNERYVAINFQNPNTVELRYFRGNLVGATILARFEFVHAMWEYTRTLSIADVRGGALDASQFLAWSRERATQFPQFVAFINDRNI